MVPFAVSVLAPVVETSVFRMIKILTMRPVVWLLVTLPIQHLVGLVRAPKSHRLDYFISYANVEHINRYGKLCTKKIIVTIYVVRPPFFRWGTSAPDSD